MLSGVSIKLKGIVSFQQPIFTLYTTGKTGKSDNQNCFQKSESLMRCNVNSEFVHGTRSIAIWGRHSGGDEPTVKSPGASE